MSGMATAVSVRALGKRFHIGEKVKRHNTLRDLLASKAREGIITNWRRKRERRAQPHVWALQHIDFDVNQGQAVGIIGANGAGKSTLLKILSRITEPTEGEIRIRGRVGSLLEVGTGFHSELTGRENTYLSGAILGMRRAEIDRKFDEIIAFAGIERFIDTPVKRYSTGMYLRLAFAVAAHLEPDVLIVDEVLAVGDAEFQKRCLGKMQEVTERQGRTVFFVSHNMGAVQRLCDRCLLLRQGRLVADGPPSELIPLYLDSGSAEFMPETWLPLDRIFRRGSGTSQFTRVRYTGGDPLTGYDPYTDGPFAVRLGVSAENDIDVSSLAVTLYDTGGTKLVNADTLSLGERLRLDAGDHEVQVDIARLHLNPGRYQLGLCLVDGAGAVCDFTDSAVEVRVVEPPGQVLRRPPADGAVSCRFTVRLFPKESDGPE